jgi:hypothetical protein
MKKCFYVLIVLCWCSPSFANSIYEKVFQESAKVSASRILWHQSADEMDFNTDIHHKNDSISGHPWSSGRIHEQDTVLRYILQYDLSIPLRIPMQKLEHLSPVDTENPRMNPLFMPMVFDVRRLVHSGKTISGQTDLPYILGTCQVDSLRSVFETGDFVSRVTREVVQHLTLSHLDLVQYDQKELPKPEKLVFQLSNKKPAILQTTIKPIGIPKPDGKSLLKTSVSPWKTFGYGKLQFTQTYISKNWSKGGESNMAGLMSLYLEADYSDSKNLQFENYLDVKIGLNTVSSDTLRDFNVSTDQLKAVTKLGLRMYNDLYYSLSGEFSTQLLKNYKTNTYNMKAAFMSPAKLYIGLGVDYKKSEQKKGYNFSLLLAPLTVKLNYLHDNEKISPSSFGIDPGKHFGSELGSKFTGNLTWKISDAVKMTTKYYYYTDFKYVDTDLENTFDFMLNNYFSTSIYVHLKLDDRLKRNLGDPLLQTQELMSFGMIYRW